MRIVIVTIGSRGDVAPFVALGRAVAQAGHEVAIATNRLNADNLGAALRSAVHEPSYAANARRVGEAVRADAGAAAVIAQLEVIQA